MARTVPLSSSGIIVICTSFDESVHVVPLLVDETLLLNIVVSVNEPGSKLLPVALQISVHGPVGLFCHWYEIAPKDEMASVVLFIGGGFVP